MSSSSLNGDSTSSSDYYRNLEILLEEQADIIFELKEEIDKLNYEINKLRSKIKNDISDIIDELYSIIP